MLKVDLGNYSNLEGGSMEVNSKHERSFESVPTIIPVVPTLNVAVFPNMIMPLLVMDDRIMHGIKRAVETEGQVLLLSARGGQDGQEIDTDNLYSLGTVATIMRVIEIPQEGIKVLVQGICRARVQELSVDDDMLRARIKVMNFSAAQTAQTGAIVKSIKEISEQLVVSSQSLPPDFSAIIAKMQDPEKIVEFILSHVEVKSDVSQKLLECNNIDELLQGAYEALVQEISIVEVQERIRTHTRESINKSQNEYYLREQLKAIKKELGEDTAEEIDAMKASLEKMDIPEKIRKEIEKSIDKLERLAPDSMEATVTRNHVEWLLALPWGVYTKDNLNIARAKEILDKDHYGLHDIKERILDFISVKNLKEGGPSPILCFSGPPGTGKTSLGKSIANALGRNFYRISVGGVKDESEIRGHRRTYVGAMPGRVMHGLRKAQSMNPVILLDEIDKLGADFRGDPSAALLEVLDPQQNREFYDNYLGIPFDLSSVLFIVTCNDPSSIGGPLLDRMELIELSGYTPEEKHEIAKKYLVQRAFEDSGLQPNSVKFGKLVLETVIYEYTREAGVRNLSQVLKRLCSKAARALVEGKETISITTKNLAEFLGPKKYPAERFDKTNLVGITNGLAWTAMGGDVLKIESLLMPGSGKLILTGQLGDVMKESAQAALSYARSHSGHFKIEQEKFEKYDLHIHVPAGGVPKDGPSAGITLLSSILSTLTGRRINASIAMTGELNLRGDVMPIGGVKEKLLAARRNNLLTVIFPEDNKYQWESVKDVAQDMNVIWVKHADEVLEHVLMPLDA